MADSKMISELINAEQISGSDLLVIAILNALSSTGYLTRKFTIAELGDFLNTDLQYLLDLSTTSKTITGAINELNAKTGSDIAVSDSDNTSIAEAISALGEVTTGQATLDTNKIDGGGISYTKIGKIVIVDVNVRFKANVAADSAICSGLPSGSFIHFLIGVSQNIYRAYFDGTAIKMSDVPPAAYCTGTFVYKAN